MSTLVKRIGKVWSFINRIHSVGIVLSATTLVLMALLICYEVLMRYFFKAPSPWGLDIAEFGMVACAFFGASYVLVKGRHVRVELFISHVPPKARLILEILSSLIMLSYFIVLIWQGWEITLRSFTMNWRTSDLAELPIWPPQLIIPLSGILLCLAVISQLSSYIKALRSKGK